MAIIILDDMPNVQQKWVKFPLYMAMSHISTGWILHECCTDGSKNNDIAVWNSSVKHSSQAWLIDRRQLSARDNSAEKAIN